LASKAVPSQCKELRFGYQLASGNFRDGWRCTGPDLLAKGKSLKLCRHRNPGPIGKICGEIQVAPEPEKQECQRELQMFLAKNHVVQTAIELAITKGNDEQKFLFECLKSRDTATQIQNLCKLRKHSKRLKTSPARAQTRQDLDRMASRSNIPAIGILRGLPISYLMKRIARVPSDDI
jgi:hypothetical protein